MDVLTQIIAYGFVFVAAPLIVLLNRHSPNYEELIEQCRHETTQAAVQRVYHDTHSVPATEAICGVRSLKMNRGKVVTFEMPVTFVKP